MRDGWWEWVAPDIKKKKKEDTRKEKRKRGKGRTIKGHSCPRESEEGRERVKHQLSSATVTVDERELSCTFWRMMSRRGLDGDGGRARAVAVSGKRNSIIHTPRQLGNESEEISGWRRK